MVMLFDQFNLSEDIYDIIFSTAQQSDVARLLIAFIKQEGGEIGKTEMSLFATKLHEGELVQIEKKSIGPKKKKAISYNKRQFYDRILTPMKAMGMIRFDLYKKTYSISEQFTKNMTKIGLLWVRQVRK